MITMRYEDCIDSGIHGKTAGSDLLELLVFLVDKAENLCGRLELGRKNHELASLWESWNCIMHITVLGNVLASLAVGQA